MRGPADMRARWGVAAGQHPAGVPSAAVTGIARNCSARTAAISPAALCAGPPSSPAINAESGRWIHIPLPLTLFSRMGATRVRMAQNPVLSGTFASVVFGLWHFWLCTAGPSKRPSALAWPGVGQGLARGGRVG
jgi:hypothetical protein